ncbi:hypothetical protein GCM10023093_26210 [Nemorincola caseinilytica]|uniref:Homing endonuclease LAGLIDADG domain-containing protein n=1 Tax=Nemorincola caseinilytica TaxID=2054315 RepID=A0ABP8NNR1_9BACT
MLSRATKLTEDIEYIIGKLKNKEKFGLFDDGSKCYFQDGTRIHYTDLWRAIRVVNGIGESRPCKRLPEECPQSFVGIFSYKYSKHNWK